MTEDEAKTKWCPQARADRQGPEYATANRDGFGQPDGACLCIGSACMGWRVHAEKVVEGIQQYGGYCGMAGRP